jgi:hypothetical protein
MDHVNIKPIFYFWYRYIWSFAFTFQETFWGTGHGNFVWKLQEARKAHGRGVRGRMNNKY